MTLEQIASACAEFAFNEITGELIRFLEPGLSEKRSQLIPREDNSSKTFLLGLFAEDEIAKNWTSRSAGDAIKIMSAHMNKVYNSANGSGKVER